MVQYCEKTRCFTILVESGDRFARDLVVQETGLAWMKELHIEVVPVDQDTMFTDPSPTNKMVRQMLGSIYEFFAAETPTRMQHGRQQALRRVELDPKGRHSYAGKAKLGGAKGILEGNRELRQAVKRACAPGRRLNLTALGLELQKMQPTRWCVTHGPNRGSAWSAKQVGSFVQAVTRRARR